MQKVISIILSVLLVVSTAFGGITYYRLDKARTELDNIRVELAEARDRQSDIKDIVTRTGNILSESRNTLSGIREQIQLIKAVYEDMARRLNSSDSYTDNKTNKLEGN